MRAFLLAGLGLLWAAEARAVDDYDACIALIAADPARAEIEAGEWARFGGGAPARHCYALALVAIGASLVAADEMIAIAQEEPGLPDEARADILVQAGELLLDGDVPVTAQIVADQAVLLSKGGADALGLRGAAKLAQGRPQTAFEDLNAALAAKPGTVRMLVRRAAAQRQLGNAVAARDDAVFASERAPDNADAWLERGRAEAALGVKPAARTSLLRAIALDRDGRVGRAAQLALQRMEAGITD